MRLASNQAPVLNTPLSDQRASEGVAFAFQIPPGAFVDPDDGDTLTFSARLAGGAALPAWLRFDAKSATFQGTPDDGSAGSLTIEVTATDGFGATVSDKLILVVEDAGALVGTEADDRLRGTAGADLIEGLAGNDTLYGYAGNDILDGGEGNDYLDGGAGGDAMSGGAGNDRYLVDNTSDTVSEEADGGEDHVYSRVSFILDEHIERLTLQGEAAIDATGNTLINRLYGNAADNMLLGLAGDDALYGDAGNDTLDGGAGDDVLVGRTGNDRLIGGAGDDRYQFGLGDGSDRIDNQNGSLGDDVDVVAFGAGIAATDLRLSRQGNHLLVEVLGTQDRLRVEGWYADEAAQLDEFQLASGEVLLRNQVDRLISALAGFEPTVAGELDLTPAQQTQYQQIVADYWWAVA